MKITPLRGYVLLTPIEKQTRTLSGLIIAEEGESQALGEITAVGPETYEGSATIKCPVKVGDQVAYKQWGGEDLEVAGQKHKLVKFSDLLAVVDQSL